ncbi:MAG: VUT family protein [Alphaproteobacteria bacterium]|nr:VUT family protein [Alphaproteobacteria bacterium]MDP6588876.1 VUT family protein [Alphaproteobacteria bacterium]MDP6818823.1 VUT family protein [Alphaproteobacteria bacterium]
MPTLSEIMRPAALFWSALYIGLIVLVNWLFTVVQPIDMGGGEMWPPVALVVGLIFIARDFAQRVVGHWVLAAMLVAGYLSYELAGPKVAYASVAAFAISELADWLIYSFTKRPFAQRILFSSAVATPIDSVVFLGMMGWLSAPGVLAMTASKMVGALIVWYLVRKRIELEKPV